MQFRILGPLEVADGDSLLPLPGAKQRALLALLLLNVNETISTDRLIEELWGDQTPESGRAALQVRISQLRKALGPAGELVQTRPPGYVLRLEREQLDLHQFERLVAEAHAAEPALAAAKLREALALWRGTPLADLSYEAFAQPAIRRLEELRVSTVEKRIDADLALGRHPDLVPELEALVAEHPLRERLRGQLMLALYRSGRQAEALDAYRSAREHLTGELGLEPGPELRALQAAILDQDPVLAGSPPTLDTPRTTQPDGRRALPDPDGGGSLARGVRLICRDRELDELTTLLVDSEIGLLTLTGTGGIGKTTLALQAAREVGRRFVDGVAVVWLASVVGAQQVVPELARVLGIELSAREPALETITRALGPQQRLLVLDNFEHVIAAARRSRSWRLDAPI
jgi:DNA-binding SARP family transcriptional activator